MNRNNDKATNTPTSASMPGKEICTVVFTNLHLCVLAGADITSSCTFKKGLVKVKVKVLIQGAHTTHLVAAPPPCL